MPVVGQAFTFDTEAPPNPVINSAPSNPTTSTSASFSLCDDSDNDGDSGCGDPDDVGGAVVWCSLDGSTPVACTSPVSYGGLSLGSHTFKVYAVDLAGNQSAGTTSYTWVIGKASPAVATSLSASTIPVGGSVHDTATLSGATTNAGGSVTYSYYTNNACTTGAVSLTPVTVTTHIVPNSSTVGFASTGTYYWQAVYTGDGSNNGARSACTSEQLTVNKAAPSISTSASGPVTIGGSITDTATLTGAYGTPVKGTVTFNVYAASDNDADDNGNDNAQGNEDGNNQGSDNGDDSCKTPLNSTPIATLTTGTSGGNPTYTSAPFTPTKAGTYVWVASFAGDTNNKPVTEGCGGANETTTVNRAQPALSTSATGSVTVGGTVSDTATLSGLVSPDGTGAVVFGLFSNSHCTGLPIFVSSSGGVSGNGGYGSGNYTTTTANPSGDYWAALYTGDSNNNPVVESCGGTHETTLVNKATPSITTKLSATSINVNGTAYDTASLSAATSNADGSVAYSYYTNNTCTTGAKSVNTVTVTGGGVPNSSTVTFTSAGTFYWQAVYAGDSNNTGASSPCTAANNEQLTVGTQTGLPFTVNGNPIGLSYPGGVAQPINLTFTNPNNVPITVTLVAGTVASVTPVGANTCSASYFSFGQQLLISVVVPANQNTAISLSALGYTDQTKWPTLVMADSGIPNQDGCESATINLSFTGSAHS